MDPFLGNFGGDDDKGFCDLYKSLMEDGDDFLHLDFIRSPPQRFDNMGMNFEDNLEKLMEPAFIPVDFAECAYSDKRAELTNPAQTPMELVEPVYLPANSQTLFAILGQIGLNGEIPGGLELFSWDPNEFQLLHDLNEVPADLNQLNTTAEAVGIGVYGRSSQNGGDEMMPLLRHGIVNNSNNIGDGTEAFLSLHSTSYGAPNVSMLEQELPNQGTQVSIMDVATGEEIKNYFYLPDYGDTAPRVRPTKSASVLKTSKKAREPKLKRKARRKKTSALNPDEDDDDCRLLTNPTKEELLKLATLPGEECFDLTKRLSPDDLELIHEKSKDSRSKKRPCPDVGDRAPPQVSTSQKDPQESTDLPHWLFAKVDR